MADVIVAVGTAKGVFVLRSSDRDRFRTTGPHLPGDVIYSVGLDARRDGVPRVLAGSTSDHWGTSVRFSDDAGKKWSDPVLGNVKFPEGTDAAVAHVWQLQPAGADEPGVVYAGVEPAALFRSEDGGESFSLLRGLWDHPHRPRWMPGGGGLCLHTVVVNRADPQRVAVAISAAGVYTTEDGGESWSPANVGLPGVDDPNEAPEFGQCVHRMAADPQDPDRLFMQFHGGVFRSDDFGGKWESIEAGLPSNFGFPLVVHPRRPGTAFTIPLNSDAERWTVGGKCRVFCTTDGGASWEPLAKGLPQRGAYLTVLRDAFAGDGMDPAGLYFGTRTGELYGSADEGETWKRLAHHLPPVLSVRACVSP